MALPQQCADIEDRCFTLQRVIQLSDDHSKEVPIEETSGGRCDRDHYDIVQAGSGWSRTPGFEHTLDLEGNVGNAKRFAAGILIGEQHRPDISTNNSDACEHTLVFIAEELAFSHFISAKVKPIWGGAKDCSRCSAILILHIDIEGALKPRDPLYFRDASLDGLSIIEFQCGFHVGQRR